MVFACAGQRQPPKPRTKDSALDSKLAAKNTRAAQEKVQNDQIDHFCCALLLCDDFSCAQETSFLSSRFTSCSILRCAVTQHRKSGGAFGGWRDKMGINVCANCTSKAIKCPFEEHPHTTCTTFNLQPSTCSSTPGWPHLFCDARLVKMFLARQIAPLL